MFLNYPHFVSVLLCSRLSMITVSLESKLVCGSVIPPKLIIIIMYKKLYVCMFLHQHKNKMGVTEEESIQKWW